MFTPHRAFLLLLTLTAVLYAPTLGYGFLYEDNNDPQAFFKPFDARDVLVKPARSLTALSFEANAALFGRFEPAGYHAGNLLLHLVNGSLVYAVALTVLGPWGAVFAAGLFLLHPMQVESVAYVSSRADLVAVFGVLLALLAASYGSIAGTVCGVVLAGLGKETAIVAWGLVPLWAWWTAQTLDRKALAWWGATGLLAAGYLVTQYPLSLSLLDMGNTLMSLTDLLARVIVPVGLTIDHDWQWSQPMQIAGVLWLVLVPALLSHRSALSFALLWCLVCIAPRLLVSLHEGLHEHHMLLPMVGVSLAFGSLFTPKDSYGIAPSLASA